jgi:hypothetical protein
MQDKHGARLGLFPHPAFALRLLLQPHGHGAAAKIRPGNLAPIRDNGALRKAEALESFACQRRYEPGYRRDAMDLLWSRHS